MDAMVDNRRTVEGEDVGRLGHRLDSLQEVFPQALHPSLCIDDEGNTIATRTRRRVLDLIAEVRDQVPDGGDVFVWTCERSVGPEIMSPLRNTGVREGGT